ncbi:hypothetical protein BFP70_02525 [Thioclava sp. SK-1]|uniref:DUF6614 family protein n=1 Tax=Thioclava sp. SK-1 TaxID=1889770 RepID=UPI0008267811|nr:DUF6614 family protein [Thioclava sp. SK-1]OCX67062.1 hypothetical protein BFP70_02525 [Thioclava sp. SK-1]
MNLYHCMIELKSDAKALAFAAAVEQWIAPFQAAGHIMSWRLMRRKLRLGSQGHADFLLEIEVQDMAMLEAAFHAAGQADDAHARQYQIMHGMIATIETGLYRDFPDPERRERIALI